MALNPTSSGDSHNWNYSRPDDPGFSLSLIGTVAFIQEVQAMNFGADGRPSTPKFWDNSGQPVWNIRMVLVGPKGGFRTWTFTPAGKAQKEGKMPSVHIDLFNLAGGKNLLDLVGKTIRVETDAPPQGFGYGRGNPRPWRVSLVEDQGPFELTEQLDPVYLMPQVLANGAVTGGVINSNPTPYPTGGPVSGTEAPAQAPSSVPEDAPF